MRRGFGTVFPSRLLELVLAPVHLRHVTLTVGRLGPGFAVIGAYALLCFLWSTTWIGIKVGLHGAPPLIGAGIRFLVAGCCIAGFWLARRRRLQVPRGQHRFVALTALCVFGIPYALVYLGETEVESGLAAVLFATLPLFSALLAYRLLPDEPLTAAKVGGITLGIAGLIVVFHGGITLRSTATALLAMVGVLVARPSRRSGRSLPNGKEPRSRRRCCSPGA